MSDIIEQNVYEQYIVPEVPKVIDTSQVFIYLPAASSTKLGGIKVGDGLVINSYGVLSVNSTMLGLDARTIALETFTGIDTSIPFASLAEAANLYKSTSDFVNQSIALATDAKTVTAAINELVGLYVKQEVFITSVERTYTPVASELTSLVQDPTIAGRDPVAGDVIYWTYDPAGSERNTLYKCMYYKYVQTSTGSNWNWGVVGRLETATNTDYGTVMGTTDPGTSDTKNVDVSIANGIIQSILVTATEGKIDLAAAVDSFNTVKSYVNDIIAGTIVVPKADADGNGDNIAATYAPLVDVYTKSMSDDRYLSKNLAKTWFIDSDDVKEIVPSDTDAKFTVDALNSDTNVNLMDLVHTITGDYDLAPSTRIRLSAWLEATKEETVDVIFTFLFKRQQSTQTDADYITAVTIHSGEIVLTAGTKTQYVFEENLNSLLASYDIDSGDLVRFKVDIERAASKSNTFNLYSDTTYPTSFVFVISTAVQQVNYIAGHYPVAITSDMVTESDGVYTATIVRAQHMQPIQKWYDVKIVYDLSGTIYTFSQGNIRFGDEGQIYIDSLSSFDELIASNVTAYVAAGAISSEQQIITGLVLPANTPTAVSGALQYSHLLIINESNSQELGVSDLVITRTEAGVTLTASQPKTVTVVIGSEF